MNRGNEMKVVKGIIEVNVMNEVNEINRLYGVNEMDE